MKKAKILLILVIVVICGLTIWVVTNSIQENEPENPTEITPKEEMTEEQERQTIISLYYINIETNTLIPEARVIDAKNLLENPYKTLIEYLLTQPKNEKLKASIPDGTTIRNAEIKDNVVRLDLSKEIIENRSEEEITLSINAIVNTLTELNEVKAVKILVEGEEDKKIEETGIDFSKVFIRQ